MVGMEAVAEGMADYLIGNHAAMPRLGEGPQALNASCRFEDGSRAIHDGDILVASHAPQCANRGDRPTA